MSKNIIISCIGVTLVAVGITGSIYNGVLAIPQIIDEYTNYMSRYEIRHNFCIDDDISKILIGLRWGNR